MIISFVSFFKLFDTHNLSLEEPTVVQLQIVRDSSNCKSTFALTKFCVRHGFGKLSNVPYGNRGWNLESLRFESPFFGRTYDEHTKTFSLDNVQQLFNGKKRHWKLKFFRLQWIILKVLILSKLLVSCFFLFCYHVQRNKIRCN